MAGIYGLSGSGMDVDTMVKGLMKSQQMRYDKLKQQKTLMEWKKADYASIYKQVSDFRTAAFDFKLQSSLSPKATTSSNSTAVTATALADAANVSHTITVTSLASGATATSTGSITTGASKDSLVSQFGLTAGTFVLNVSDGSTSKDITVDTTKSMNDLVSSINNAGVNVKANYDATLDRFFLYSTNSGSAAKIDFSSSSAEGQAFLTTNLKLPGLTAAGQDAVFKLDGVDLTQGSNNFTISGVSYTLNNAGTATVSVATDVDKAVSNVKAFVETYNKLLDSVNSKLSEAKYADFAPLTDEQRSAMKDTEITAWEEKAKSGMLRNDSILRDAISRVRQNMSVPVSGISGSYTTLASIGITTGDYSENGKLYVDETKLKAALQADPAVLSRMFATDGTTSNTDGVAQRLYDTAKTVMDKIYKQAGISASITSDTKSTLAKQIREMATRMSDQSDRMNTIQTRYYKQFNAMETALSQLSKQSQWLSQQSSG